MRNNAPNTANVAADRPRAAGKLPMRQRGGPNLHADPNRRAQPNAAPRVHWPQCEQRAPPSRGHRAEWLGAALFSRWRLPLGHTPRQPRRPQRDLARRRPTERRRRPPSRATVRTTALPATLLRLLNSTTVPPTLPSAEIFARVAVACWRPTSAVRKSIAFSWHASCPRGPGKLSPPADHSPSTQPCTEPRACTNALWPNGSRRCACTDLGVAGRVRRALRALGASAVLGALLAQPALRQWLAVLRATRAR